MSNFSYKVLSEEEKKVEITYNNKKIRFQLKVKRSFTVLKKLLEAYAGMPEWLNGIVHRESKLKILVI